MDFSMNMKSLDCYKKADAALSRNEYTADAVVPDTLEDISRVLSACAVPVLHTKENGAASVRLAGDIEVTVMYVPESEKGVCALKLKIPFSSEHETDNAPEAVPIAQIRAVSVDVRILNPRKILARCELLTKLDCYIRESLLRYDGVENAAEAGVFVKTAHSEIETVSLVTERTFVLADEHHLPAGRATPEKILCYDCSLSVNDVQDIGSRVIIKGLARTGVYYCGADGEPEYISLESPFSQLIEIPAEGASSFEITPMLTDAYVEITRAGENDRCISIELHVLAQLLCRARGELCYIDDAYSIKGELELSRGSIKGVSETKTEKYPAALRTEIETARPCAAVIGALALAGVTASTAEGVSAALNVNVVYRADDGRLYGENRRESVQTQLPSPMQCAALGVGEALTIPSGEGVEVRVPLDFTMQSAEAFEIAPVTGMVLNEEGESESAPSVTVVRTAGEDLWTLAKKYRSDAQLIAECNGIEEDALPAESVILIPKA